MVEPLASGGLLVRKPMSDSLRIEVFKINPSESFGYKERRLCVGFCILGQWWNGTSVTVFQDCKPLRTLKGKAVFRRYRMSGRL